MPLSQKAILYLVFLLIGWVVAIIFAGLFAAQMDYKIRGYTCTLEDTGLSDWLEGCPPFPRSRPKLCPKIRNKKLGDDVPLEPTPVSLLFARPLPFW